MDQRSLSKAQEDRLRQFAEKIFQFDGRIRFVYFTGPLGRLDFSAHRSGIVSLEPEVESTRLFEQDAIGKGIVKDWDRYHGRTKTMVIEREKVILMAFPREDSSIIVTAEPDFAYSKMPGLKELVAQAPREMVADNTAWRTGLRSD